MPKSKPVAGVVSPEVAEAVDAYARRHGVTRSRAVAILLANATRQPVPAARKRGRPRKRRDAQ